jgi:hypothetical protein
VVIRSDGLFFFPDEFVEMLKDEEEIEQSINKKKKWW